MPLDIPAPVAGAMESEPKFVEPQFPAAESDDWHAILRQIFETEGGLWQRRAAARRPVTARQ
jgi:hypothetical protein